MSTKRKSVEITGAERDEILSLSNKDCLKTSVFMEYFGDFKSHKRKYNVYDILRVPKGTYHNNKNEFTTTIGRWFFNKAVIDYNDLFPIFQYINNEITKGAYKKMNNKLSYALLEDRITVDQIKGFIMSFQKLMPYTTIICPTATEGFLTISNRIAPKKKELLKKYEKEIKEHNALEYNRLEKELLDYSLDLLEEDGDEALDLLKSGAGADIGNNYKNMYITKGAQKNPDPTKPFNIITSCYAEGMSREDYPKICNSLAAGPYARACNTADGGYVEKLFLSAFQHLVLDKKGTDCGTTRTIEVTLDNTYLPLVMYSYIVEGGKLIRLDSTNMDKYAGKKVKMRFSSLCEHEKICNKCAGDLFYLLGTTNVGVITPQLAACVKVISMKAFHDSTDKYRMMDIMKAFGY